MAANYGHIIFYSLVGGLLSLAGGALLLGSRRSAVALAKYATPFAAGALIAAVFMDLLREGVTETNVTTLMLSVMVGITLFYLGERFLRWFHHRHRDDESEHEHSHDATLPLIIWGDTVHNALDGVAIAASFLISVPTGIVTTIAVAAHEIPHEIGDFGLMLHKGMGRRRVLLVNAVSALATTTMAVITFAIGSSEALPMGALIGLSAGFLLYIALSDIIPELHEHDKGKRFFDWQPLLLVAGIVAVTVMIQLAHKYVDSGHAGEAGGQAPHSLTEHACQRAARESKLPNAGISHDEVVCLGQIQP